MGLSDTICDALEDIWKDIEFWEYSGKEPDQAVVRGLAYMYRSLAHMSRIPDDCGDILPIETFEKQVRYRWSHTKCSSNYSNEQLKAEQQIYQRDHEAREEARRAAGINELKFEKPSTLDVSLAAILAQLVNAGLFRVTSDNEQKRLQWGTSELYASRGMAFAKAPVVVKLKKVLDWMVIREYNNPKSEAYHDFRELNNGIAMLKHTIKDYEDRRANMENNNNYIGFDLTGLEEYPYLWPIVRS